MALCTVNLTVKVAWWVKPYIVLVAGIAAVTGWAPSAERIERTLLRGISVRLS